MLIFSIGIFCWLFEMSKYRGFVIRDCKNVNKKLQLLRKLFLDCILFQQERIINPLYRDFFWLMMFIYNIVVLTGTDYKSALSGYFLGFRNFPTIINVNTNITV